MFLTVLVSLATPGETQLSSFAVNFLKTPMAWIRRRDVTDAQNDYSTGDDPPMTHLVPLPGSITIIRDSTGRCASTLLPFIRAAGCRQDVGFTVSDQGFHRPFQCN